MVEVNVAMIAVDAEGSPVLLLRPVDGAEAGVMLPIWIGPMETAAIMVASGLTDAPERPLTYDLMVRLLDALGGSVRRVEVTALVEGTFHATLTLLTPEGERPIDARPSDSIALALRVGAPIFVADEVMAEAAIPDVTHDAGQTLAEFTDFIEQVEPDDFRN